MTTNQTIDGVPRELATLLLRSLNGGSDTLTGLEHAQAYKELRALLDAPASFTVNKCGVQMVDCPECTHQWDHFFECANQPTAQPQGEPVACPHEWTDDGEFLLVCTACGAQEDYTKALQLAFELGGTDDGSYHLEADELCEILRLHAEQPAPVAVMLPEFESAFEKWWEEHGQYCRAGGGSYEKTFAYRAYEAALSDVTRLNTK